MNVQKLLFSLLMLSSLSGVSVVQAAEPEPANMVIYINPMEYKHPVKLWHFYHDHWYTQGPVVEGVAMQVLNDGFGKTAMCEGNNIGNTLIRIIPNMFYNPHMTMFYGKITADVFTGSGKLIGTYIGESQKPGFLDVATEAQVEAAYRIAMQEVVAEMQADRALMDAVQKGVPASETSTPCSMMMVLPRGRLNATDLLNTFER